MPPKKQETWRAKFCKGKDCGALCSIEKQEDGNDAITHFCGIREVIKDGVSIERDYTNSKHCHLMTKRAGSAIEDDEVTQMALAYLRGELKPPQPPQKKKAASVKKSKAPAAKKRKMSSKKK